MLDPYGSMNLLCRMNNNVTVLQVGPLMPTVQDAVADLMAPSGFPIAPTDQAGFLERHGRTVDVAVTSGRFGVGTELMRALPGLRAVVNFGVGYDTTDTRQAAERGIAVSNTPDVLNDCVADTAMALYLDVLRRTSAADRYVRRGDWVSKGNFPLATKASGKRVGILGPRPDREGHCPPARRLRLYDQLPQPQEGRRGALRLRFVSRGIGQELRTW